MIQGIFFFSIALLNLFFTNVLSAPNHLSWASSYPELKPLALSWKIKQLGQWVKQKQVSQSSTYWPPFVFPPAKWTLQKGLFESSVHINFKGNPALAALRNLFQFPDDNGFVTSNVLETLLAAHAVGFDLDESIVQEAMDVIITHRDRNSDASTPVFQFWNQHLINVTNGTQGYMAAPSNIVIPLKQFGSIGGILEKFAETIHLKGPIRQAIDLVQSFSGLGDFLFAIPPDADDTGCALGVSANLHFLASEKNEFRKSNADFQSAFPDDELKAFSAYKKYAYNPLANSSDMNVIDPRTYHWLRGFLNEKVEKGAESISLITTWFQSLSEIPSQSKFQHMPFDVNNVDASVGVNGLFGLSSLLIYQTKKYAPVFDATFYELFQDTTDMIVYILEHDLLKQHASTILLYYPSRFAFYYFISRYISLIERASIQDLYISDAMKKLFSTLYEKLSHAMKKYGTRQLLGLMKPQRIDDKTILAYWDDFLGQGDSPATFDDRLFSTSMATNALLNVWTTYEGPGKLVWKEDTPESVKEAILASGRFLLSDETDHENLSNAFFSASVKGVDTLPMFSVTNYRKSPDGTKSLECDAELNSQGSGFGFVFGVQGIISEEEYLEREKKGCFNKPTSNPDIDYNW